MPALANAGVKKVVNGPFTFGPDGNPLIGPVPGLSNYWTAVGVMAGFCQGGGVGLCMAEWMIHGEPAIDVWGMDVARFGSFATRDWGTIKSRENYSRRFRLTYPNETLPEGRRQKTTALYDRFIERGAVMGVSFGLEHAQWFAGTKDKAEETPTFRRSNAFSYVADEVKAVREHVGMIEIANYAKHEFKGPDVAAFLDRLLANNLPQTGRLALTPMLTPKGRLFGDLTVAKLDDDTFMLFGSGVAQEMHRRWFEMHMPKDGVSYRNATDELHGFAISGPKARTLLSRLTRDDVSNGALKFRDIRRMVVADVPVILTRVSFSGELGYEIYCAHQFHMRLFEALESAGADLGLKLYGGRALMSMRLEKNWGVWTLDYRPDFTAAEAGLDGFIAFGKKAEFIGKAAAKADKPGKRLVTMIVDTKDVDCLGDEPVFHDGKCVGYVSSGGYAHHVKMSMAMGYVPIGCANDGTELEIELLGDFYKAYVVARPVYDPDGLRMRS